MSTMLDGIHISFGGPQRVIFDAKQRRWDFEMHDYLGPTVTNRTGDIKDKQPGTRSPFWHAFYAWQEQGKKLEGDVCQWVEPVKPEYVCIGGKNYALAGSKLAKQFALASQPETEKK